VLSLVNLDPSHLTHIQGFLLSRVKQIVGGFYQLYSYN